MRFFLFSALVLCASCRSAYKGLEREDVARPCAAGVDAPFLTSWYKASVDVYGHHLSGLLLVKNIAPGEYRVVLTSEAGVTLFDMAISSDGSFEVKRIIRQMDRKPVIEVLRKDFMLLLRLPFASGQTEVFRRDDELFVAATEKNETAYFITDKDCASLRRLEWASARKTKVTIALTGPYKAPESALIRHHTFDMVIKLKKIERE